jgi:hypothetical protein
VPDVTSAAGDCFNRLAKAQGFHNYLTVYNHADNATVFPNPNCVEVGSTVKIPEKQMKLFDLPLDGEKKFKIVRKPAKLSIGLCTADATQAPKIAKAKLVVGGKSAVGTSGALVVEDIDSLVTAATLTVVLAKPAKFAGPPATATGPADQNPPAIVADDFDDPDTIWPKQGQTIEWTLEVGHLEPHTSVRGVLQRLENLGFGCPVQQAEDAATRRAVRTYRRAVESKVAPDDTDAVADIRAHIKSRHDD